MKSSSRHHKKEDDVALADKEMEERANRAKELLSMRYKGMRHEQVGVYNETLSHKNCTFNLMSLV